MRILVTGHRGYIGGPVVNHLVRLSHDIARFYRANSEDLLAFAIERAADGCGSSRSGSGSATP